MQVLRNAYHHRKERINKVLGSFISQSLLLLILFVGIRLLEYKLLTTNHSIEGMGTPLLKTAILRSLVWWVYVVSILCIPYFIFSVIAGKLSRWSFAIIGTLVCAIDFGLTQYFSETLNLLGADLFAYSYDELKTTIAASGALGFASVLGMILGISALLFSLRFVPGLRFPIIIQFAAVVMIFFTGCLKYELIPKSKQFPSEGAWQFANSKSLYFLDNTLKITERTLPNFSELYISGNSQYDNMQFAKTWNFEKEYPFYRDTALDYSLSPYFVQQKKSPNIVFIIVESLGAAYSGHNAYLGSFTPFIDSLAKKGLNYTSALSTTGRTFGVLSGITGSLPFGDNGFLELEEKTPRYHSLFTELEPMSYSYGFYYGSEATFDNMSSYITANRFQKVIDKDDYPSSYKQLPSASNGFSWGYGDKEMFDYGITQLPQSPHVSTFLTVASHSPFLVQDQDVYEQKAVERINQQNRALKFDLTKYKQELATILYTDDAVKQFITDYQQRPDFENTIFIITGDHRMPEIPLSHKLDRFHVPLVIYSPLITQPKQFSQVVSHFDVVPSLLGLLKKNFRQKISSSGAWLGNGLGQSSSFESAKNIPLMRNKNEFGDYVWGPYYLSDQQAFKINPDLSIKPVGDRNLSVRMLNEINNFKDAQKRAIEEDKLIP